MEGLDFMEVFSPTEERNKPMTDDNFLDRPIRYALVRGHNLTADRVAVYLPRDYKVEGEVTLTEPWGEEKAVVIGGRDWHGWTLDDYVIPRLGSGMMAATEIGLSHPVMAQLNAFPKEQPNVH